MKWTWGKFGFHTSELTANPAPILECLGLCDDSITVHFYSETGMALVVCDLPGTVAPDGVYTAKRVSCWDVSVCTTDQRQEMQNKARTQLSRLDIKSEWIEELVAKGIFTLDAISVLEPDRLAQRIRVDQPEADDMIERADLLCCKDSCNE